ncbi:2-amino-4-hydroxy-6-hydroxymethyldihydropteridine diphosphokinase [Bacillus tianshenii]|uniref:2-amino-4-hydroxy-6- hydroxymethyldihydropteridine diphosphokinase n=1 Tax=Sutcliffiella tianshenii TaxID=1463404 RepID=UPI001CD7C50E|nr:2-amino-4-hydroxy-6-hydroxymethyldihydropteridine diphosphokinase [Bacillus tianshenii]MCA1322097.1 2-amino-4-hydroxy-6-hydroxymethyldihydropteridine diphosphokinase [Bacillus tianshenii]
MMNTSYIALGSNQGDRAELLYRAIRKLEEDKEVEVERTSSIYETDPVGYTDQEKFLNMVIKVNTSYAPLELLKVLQEIEHFFGRERKIRWGPRTLDLDILLYNQENIENEELIIPHPRMWERAFVLVPLIEIADRAAIPKIIDEEALLELQDREGVQVWKPKNGEDVSERFES